jgi:hypothetical protein
VGVPESATAMLGQPFEFTPGVLNRLGNRMALADVRQCPIASLCCCSASPGNLAVCSSRKNRLLSPATCSLKNMPFR